MHSSGWQFCGRKTKIRGQTKFQAKIESLTRHSSSAVVIKPDKCKAQDEKKIEYDIQIEHGSKADLLYYFYIHGILPHSLSNF